MSFISQLDVINAMLSTLGEAPLNTIDTGHPLVASGLSELKMANLREQGKSWWFNKELVTLTPDAISSYIYTPDDSLRVDPTQGCLNYVQRGRRLYNVNSLPSSDPYKFTSAVQCWLVRLVDFEDLPSSAATLISYAAQIAFQAAFDADRAKLALLQSKYEAALKDINAEHTRNVNANMFNRAGVRDIMQRVTPRLNNGESVFSRY